MKAVCVIAPGELVVTDAPEPDAGGNVVVRSSTVGICGTDVKILKGKIPVVYPRILGHEMVGVVVEAPVGSSFAPGDRVLVDPAVSCGKCAMCSAGRPNICLDGGLVGRDVDGVFAELAAVPESRLTGVPAAITDGASGLLQVLGTCVHAVEAIDTSPGQTAAVIGLGVGGQLISQLLTLRGIAVVGITRSEWKRELAERSGVVATSGPESASAMLNDVTSGRGPQIVVEAVGKEETLSQAISAAATGGQVLVFGTITGGSQGLPYYELYHKELTLFNPRAATIEDYGEAVRLAASGNLDLENLVTDRLPLNQAERAFQRAVEPDSLKVLMTL
ncbi:MAG TPA: alcohol dehydrogenase catalytic domain-containing protein [Acidimicrobiia bacterium]|nr:alcohol dehydrogenase catalytic domain-containing protein [Acidimicrobiia bacterium]